MRGQFSVRFREAERREILHGAGKRIFVLVWFLRKLFVDASEHYTTSPFPHFQDEAPVKFSDNHGWVSEFGSPPT